MLMQLTPQTEGRTVQAGLGWTQAGLGQGTGWAGTGQLSVISLVLALLLWKPKSKLSLNLSPLGPITQIRPLNKTL